MSSNKVKTIFNTNNRDHINTKMFLDENGNVGTARFDTFNKNHKFLENHTVKQTSFFWVPEEIDLSKDRGDFMSLSPGEQHIFTSNLKRQIILDSVQGRAPGLTFMRVTSSPGLESFIETWQYFESIHSRSYSTIIRAIYTDPSTVFDQMMDIKEITDCVEDVSKYYQDCYDKITLWEAQQLTGQDLGVTLYDVKRAIWLALMSVNILEGVRFYVSFACSWSFAEQAQVKMAGNASIIKLICRD